MARYDNGINGRFHGKIGPTVGCTWKGVDYMRSRPRPSSKPPTESQLLSRAKFAFMKKWLDPIGLVVGMGFNNYSPRMTGRMAAHSYNYHHALRGEYPDFEIDYASALVTTGPLEGTAGLKAWFEDGKVKVSWEPDGAGLPSDNLILTIYYVDKAYANCLIGRACREDGYYEYVVADSCRGLRMELFVSFKSLMDEKFSDSQYAGRIN